MDQENCTCQLNSKRVHEVVLRMHEFVYSCKVVTVQHVKLRQLIFASAQFYQTYN